jgi:hypothetical protein
MPWNIHQGFRVVFFGFSTGTESSPIAPECTSTRLRITQNLVEDSLFYIVYNFEVKRTLIGEVRKELYHRPFESYNNSPNHPIDLKICQHTQIG